VAAVGQESGDQLLAMDRGGQVCTKVDSSVWASVVYGVLKRPSVHLPLFFSNVTHEESERAKE
jgi:hypothetical protein